MSKVSRLEVVQTGARRRWTLAEKQRIVAKSEREIRPIAMGRKNWTFAGSDEGGRRSAAIYTLINTAKLNDVDPQAWLADILSRLQDHPARRIDELLPWNWKPRHTQKAAA